MKSSYSYPIGEPGKKWTEVERTAWRESQTIKREYQQEVVPKIKALSERFDVEQYGALSYDEARFPLFAIKTKAWDASKPTVLVTGGVHGYETSGDQVLCPGDRCHGQRSDECRGPEDEARAKGFHHPYIFARRLRRPWSERI